MKKHIALISEHASPLAILGGTDNGGQNVYVAEVAKNLQMLGYEIDIFTRKDNPLLPEIAEWVNKVRIIHVPAGPPQFVPKEELLPYIVEFTEYILKFCQQEDKKYHLIHANFWMSGLVAAEIKKAIAIPFVITFHALGHVRRIHQGALDKFPPCRVDIEKRIIAEADKIIAECPQEQEDLIRFYNANPAKIEIIPAGFDPNQFWPIGKQLAKVALGLNSNEKVILQLGRLVPRKGVDTVIRGFSLLKEQISAKLLIVGGESDIPDPAITPEIGRLRSIAEEEGVGDKVIFIGRRGRETLRCYYSAADIFITTPWYEPFGITPVEAMACGTPVIGSNVGGIKFTVRNGETGYLVPPNDPTAIAERIKYLYENPKLTEVLRQQAIARANDLFTWANVSNALANLYEQVINSWNVQENYQSPQVIIDRSFENLLNALHKTRLTLQQPILKAAEAIACCFAAEKKVLVCGNGGSAADAQHLAAEFVGRFKCKSRKGFPVIALNADTAFLTAWSNDVGYEDIFARQVEAFGQPGDLVIGISTSGNSINIIKAFEIAKKRGLYCIALLGKNGGEMGELADISVVVPENDTQHIQEVQILIIHLICQLVELEFVKSKPTTPQLAIVNTASENIDRTDRHKKLIAGL